MENNIIDGVPEAQLWTQYRKTSEINLRDKLVKQYAPLVRYVAGKISSSLPPTVDFEDLVGFGTFGLLDAIEKFDPNKHVKFKTYAITRIRGAIFDELRAIDWVPRSIRQKSKEVEETIQRLEAEFSRPATDDEVAHALKVTPAEFAQVLTKLSGAAVLSLNDVWNNGSDDQTSILECIESPARYQPEEIVERDEIKRIIIEAIKELPIKEKKVLILYYYEELTLKEIGKVMEVTESRISQLHTKAIYRLRSRLANAKKGIF